MTRGASYRLQSGGSIHRDRPLAFTFDGRPYEGFAGDTLASALLANGVRLLGRSFKYHRPRGVATLGSSEANALVEVRSGPRREPNTPATIVELFDGLHARSQNRWPSLRRDLLAVNQLFGRFLMAGFYYKTFMWPPSFWEPVYERLIRRAAGLGRAATEPDPDTYDHFHTHCDMLVIGAGPAGLSAARTLGGAGACVRVVDENPWLGGALGYSRNDVENQLPVDWIASQKVAINALADTKILTRCTALGVFDGNVVLALERVSDHLQSPEPGRPRQRLHIIRAEQILLAAGAHEQPLLFENNDRPGVMLSSAVRGYAQRFAVASGRRIVIVTADDDGYNAARELLAHGIDVPVLADLRSDGAAAAADLNAAGVTILQNVRPRRALGSPEVQGIEFISPDGRRYSRHACDAIAMAGGYSPTVQLSCHLGAAPAWSKEALAFVPDAEECGGMLFAGACRGVYDTAACIEDGRVAAFHAARRLGLSLPAPEARPPVTPRVAVSMSAPAGKCFIDLQNDVTADDLRLAVLEGYRAVEHVKRYTTLGMATDQGKSSSRNAIAVVAEALQRPIAEIGIPRYRPPYTPAAIGAFAGYERGRAFKPIRRTALHACHEALGATFVEAADWLRPRYYARSGETAADAIRREASAARASLGICDVSTLGKIDIFGADAADFLDRVYINEWSTLAIGKARYGVMLREDGYLFDDGTTSRLAAEHYFMTCTTANAAAVLLHLEYAAQVLFPHLDVALCSATEQWCSVALAGPNSRQALAELVAPMDVSARGLPYMGVAETTIDGMPARIFRISFSGELAYEINVPAGHGETLWRRLVEIGRRFDITPYGTEALGTLRIEKGHIAGAEIDGRTTASDVGLARMMSAKKDFIGRTLSQRAALLADSRPRLVGVRLTSGAPRLRAGAHFLENRGDGLAESLGWISSVTFSPAIGSWIGLGFLSGGGNHGRQLLAAYPLNNELAQVQICDTCFVDSAGSRVRA